MCNLGNKEIFAKNLKHYMDLNNKTRITICRDLKIPYSTFTDWCNANIYPRIDKIDLLANYFNIQKSDLVENNEKIDKLCTSVVKIPLFGTIKSDYNYFFKDNIIGSIGIDEDLAKSGNFFALKIKDDSMFPVLIEDDIVIIREQHDFESGDLVLSSVNTSEATIKRGKKSSSGILLQPLNNNYESFMFTHEEVSTIPVTILGIVKQLKREFI